MNINDQQPPKEFFEKLPSRTNEELFDILAHPENYLPAAIEAANEEISRRGIEPEKRRAGAAEILSQEEAAKSDKLKQSLPLWARILTVIFCPLLLAVILWGSYRSNGFKRKAREIWMFYFIGVGWRAVVFIIILLLASSK
jgi:hypothetical protein